MILKRQRLIQIKYFVHLGLIDLARFRCLWIKVGIYEMLDFVWQLFTKTIHNRYGTLGSKQTCGDAARSMPRATTAVRDETDIRCDCTEFGFQSL